MTRKLSPSVALLLLSVAVSSLTGSSAQAFSLGVGGSGSASAGGFSASGNASLGLGPSPSGPAAPSSSPGPASTSGNAVASSSAAAGATVTSRTGGIVQAAISLINNSNWTTSTLSGTTSVTGSSAVNVTPLLNGQTQVALDQTLSANATAISNLQTALSTNAAINAWLQNQGLSTSTVIAVGQTVDGSLIFFVLN